MAELVPITGEMIEAARTNNGGWKRETLRLFGVGWPPRAGWKQQALGCLIPAADAERLLHDYTPITAGFGLFTDGGLSGSNPSPIGGSWAWCLVTEAGIVRHQGGCLRPADVGLPAITNNLTELYAAVQALEAMESGWDGVLHTDSQITLWRCERRDATRKPAGMNGIPRGLQDRLHAAKGRLGAYTVVLLGGHPTDEELADGRRADGLPVSLYNCWCDSRCSELAARLG
jgi:ribonuclease HI